MAISSDLQYRLNHSSPLAAELALGDTVQTIETDVAALQANNTGLFHDTIAISLAEMNAAGAGVKTISKTLALPAHARVMASNYTLVLIDNVGDTAVVSMKAGTAADDDGILVFADCTTGSGATLGPAIANGAKISATMPLMYDFGGANGATVTLTITSDVNLSTITKGSISLELYWMVLA